MTSTAAPSSPPSRRWTLRVGAPRFLLIATLLYTAGALLITWPLAAHLGVDIYISPQRPYGDEQGVIATYRELVEHHLNPFLSGTIPDFNYPDGQPVRWALDLASFPAVALHWTLTWAFGGVAGFGVFLLLGYVGTGVATAGLVRWLSGRVWVALLMGWAYAFCPFFVARGEHPDLVHAWPLVLLVWAGLRLAERTTVRHGLVLGGAAALAMAWNAYYILIGGVTWAALALAVVLVASYRRRLRSALPPVLTSAVPVAVFGVFLLGLGSTDPTDILRPNFLIDLYVQSARPLNYVLAPPSNPFLGHFTGATVVHRGWWGAEKTLYAGVSLLVLALVGVWQLVRRRMLPREAALAAAVLVLLVVAGLMSGPPTVGLHGHSIPLPSLAVWKISEGWRIFSRFAVVVTLALCLLAGLALSRLPLRGASGRIAAVLVAVVVVADLWTQFTPRVRELTAPRIYATLRAQPPGAVAEYPLRPAEQAGDYRDIYFQDTHGKPVINGWPARSYYESRALTLGDLSAPGVPNRLAGLGVRYVLLQRDPIPLALQTRRPGRGLRLIARDGYADLFRLIATPAASIDGTHGVFLPESDGSRWTSDRRVDLRVTAPCAPCAGHLEFTVVAYFPQHVVITNGARVLDRVGVSYQPQRVSIPMRFDREGTVTLSSDASPRPVRGTIRDSTDFRSVGYQISGARFRDATGRLRPVPW